MRHLPIYLDTQHHRILVIGAGQIAAAKLRILTKTAAELHVYGDKPVFAINTWAIEGRITHFKGTPTEAELAQARLIYAATGDEVHDAAIAEAAGRLGVLVNIVDNLEASDFITPAIVDRAPVTVAIGTEGASPVLARKLKALNEEALPKETGLIARVGKAFRPHAEALPYGSVRRAFWQRYYDEVGPLHAADGEEALTQALHDLVQQMLHAPDRPAQVAFVEVPSSGAEDLTHRARRLIHDADVILYDDAIGGDVMELARREATFINADITPNFQNRDPKTLRDILVKRAAPNAKILRLAQPRSLSQSWALRRDYAFVRARQIEAQFQPNTRAITAWIAGLALRLERLRPAFTQRRATTENRLKEQG